LKNDKDSRQAFMRFNNTSHQYEGVKDLPCTFVEIFHIRDNKLHATIEMRSNDIVKGLAHDVPSFTLFQHLMYLRLKEVYPELELGTYTHISHSLHIYEEDFELIKKRLDVGIEENSFPMP
jgi:thymidylate synthase